MSRSRHSVAKKNQVTISRKRFKAIAKYVDFKYTGTEWNKRRIRRYFRELEPVLKLGKDNYIDFNSKSARRVGVAQRAAGFDENLKGFKRIPIVTPDPAHTRIRIDGDNLVRETMFAHETIIPFTQKQLARSGGVYVERRLAKFDDKATFTVNCGNWTMDSVPRVKEDVPALVEQLMAQYVSGVDDPEEDEPLNNWWGNWLNGVTYYEPVNQRDDIGQIIIERHTSKKKRQRETKKATRQWRKKYGR